MRKLLALAFLPLVLGAAPSVAVIEGKSCEALDRFASQELARSLPRLFHIRVVPGGPADGYFLVCQSSDSTLGEQGFALRSTTYRGRPALAITGGSPRARLWGVYDLLERLGVRYLLHGDVFPPRRKFEMPRLNVVAKPRFPVRQWRVVNEAAMGPASWGMADYRPVLDQLAKLKFNRAIVCLWPHQPFLDYEYGGIRRSSATMFFGSRFPITPDMPGRSVFGSASEFWNPDLPASGYAAMTEAGIRHVRAVMDYAKSRGMDVVLSITPTEYPREFATAIKGAREVRQLGNLTVVPGPESSVDDPALRELSATIIRAALDTYPQADYLSLAMPEWRQWTSEYERAYDALDRRYGIARVRSDSALLQAAARREGYPGGSARAVDEVKGDMVSLYFYDQVFHQSPQLKERRPKLIFENVAEELFPVLSMILPRGAETLNFIDYTPARILKRKAALGEIAGSGIPATLIYTLHDDNVGVLPQLATGSLHQLTLALQEYGWAGFSTRYWLIGDHDPCVAYLAKASWDAGATPDRVYRDQITRVCGRACVPGMMKALQELESATLDLELHGMGLTFPVPGMIMSHWTPKPLDPELHSVPVKYARALEAALSARARTTGNGAAYVDYFIGRFRFGLAYFRMLEDVHKGGAAEAAGDRAGAAKHAQAAVNAARESLEAYAAVARDQSDRGTIAVLNEYVYRPLEAKLKELQK